jgi:hypothetical protein
METLAETDQEAFFQQIIRKMPSVGDPSKLEELAGPFTRHFARNRGTDIKRANPHASKRRMGTGSTLLDSLPNQNAAHLHPALMLFSADI